MRIIISFKNKIFDVLESLLVPNYKVAKKEVTSLKFLKILDNTDHLSRNTVLKRAEYFRNLVILVVLALLVNAINKNILSQFGLIFNLLPLFLLTFLVLSSYNYLVLIISSLTKFISLIKFIYLYFFKKSLKMRRLHTVLSFVKKLRIRLLILMIVTAYIISVLTISVIQNESNLKMIESFINNPFIEYNLNCIF